MTRRRLLMLGGCALTYIGLAWGGFRWAFGSPPPDSSVCVTQVATINVDGKSQPTKQYRNRRCTAMSSN